MEIDLLRDHVRQNLELFYQQRLERLQTLTLEEILATAPQNFWSTDETNAPDLVARLIEAYLTSFEHWWHTLLQDKNFCLLAHYLRPGITTPRYEYQDHLAFAHNRLTLDFINCFCRSDYTIDWAKLLRFNSGAD